MKSESLRQPRIKKQEIKRIILGRGQNLLSPERRFGSISHLPKNAVGASRSLGISDGARRPMLRTGYANPLPIYENEL